MHTPACPHGKAGRHLCKWCLAHDNVRPEYLPLAYRKAERTITYYIMDERARYDVDRAMVLQVCDEGSTLAQARAERDRDWPGQCLVDLDTNTVIDDAEGRSDAD